MTRKIMGGRPGEPRVRIVDVEDVDVRGERLDAITADDVRAKGFLDMTSAQFVSEPLSGDAIICGLRRAHRAPFTVSPSQLTAADEPIATRDDDTAARAAEEIRAILGPWLLLPHPTRRAAPRRGPGRQQAIARPAGALAVLN
ncbi:hypothetical protein [Nocardia sp. NPDC059239]|uniref:hypothetical protein n=1 Tax=Nocardia sp. NPDC059239 TaxID=3346785 RepID=UPI0036BEFDCA